MPETITTNVKLSQRKTINGLTYDIYFGSNEQECRDFAHTNGGTVYKFLPDSWRIMVRVKP